MSYNQNSGYGAALLAAVQAAVPSFGRVFCVFSPTDVDSKNYRMMQQIALADTEGVLRFHGTNADDGTTPIEQAYADAESNNNDVILLDAHTAHLLSAVLTTAKNRVNFFGMDGGGRITGQGAKIQLDTTGVATDYAPVVNTGVRNSFRNIKTINASTTNAALYGFIEAGEATLIESCSSVKTAGLDDAGHAHFFLASDSATIRNFAAGQSNIPNTAAGYGILIDGYAAGGAGGVVKENFLENIYVNMSVGGSVQATSCFLKVADGSALNFGNRINGFHCTNFIPSGGTAMTDAILGAASTAGRLHIMDPHYDGCTGVGSAAGQGINVSAGGLAPVAAGGLSTAVTD